MEPASGVPIDTAVECSVPKESNMNRLRHWSFTVRSVALTAGRTLADEPPAAPERDPEATFRKACALVAALEGKHQILEGVSKVKPLIKRDAQERVTSAEFAFARNAATPGKENAKAIDGAKPFVYISVEVWAGRTPTPPAGLHVFEWKGQVYQMWIRIYGSDAELVRAIRESVDEPLRGPFAPANPGKTAQPR